ncbi:PAC2 family protein [Candidatus Woesearchaeota archaeon]|nr:PAC2 family protein [Candidatus Woesearchaeota archaeon]MBW3006341.1 PAC2 family protein [Candidatus Woesearchaeota archaeon]
MANEKRRLILTKKPKNVTVIEGFPGIGLVGTIATGFLVDHLKCEKIGSYFFETPHTPSMIAIHECKMVDPVGIYYNKQYNVVIIHAITSATGLEWDAADLIIDVCKQLEAKELITIEGVGSTEEPAKDSNAFYFTKDPASSKKLDKLGHQCLNEGIIVGSTAAILLKSPFKTTCMFAETHTKMPDSKAAAGIVKLIDDYLGLKVDPKPLLKQAEEFEKKLKQIVSHGEKAQQLKQKKKFTYIG